jgi:hypothetical protein
MARLGIADPRQKGPVIEVKRLCSRRGPIDAMTLTGRRVCIAAAEPAASANSRREAEIA